MVMCFPASAGRGASTGDLRFEIKTGYFSFLGGVVMAWLNPNP